MEKYFVLTGSEDGAYVQMLDKEELTEWIKEQGSREINFLEEVPSDLDELCSYDETNCVIIKGKIIIPEPVETVTEYKF